MARIVRLPGLSPYAAVHELQRSLVARRAAGEIEDTVLLLEHEPTITVGRARGAAGNVLAPDGIPVVDVERGGDVTWHGPGQLVAYPIVLLEGPRKDLHRHLRELEESVILALRRAGVAGVRDPRNTGVWLTDPDGVVRKACSVGIACRRWVTWHGLALNVDTDLGWFERIRPCGFDASVMTTVAQSLPGATLAGWVAPLADALADVLELDVERHADGSAVVTVADLLRVDPGATG